MCDFAHNEDGVTKLCQTFESEPPTGQRVCLMTVPNNREDEFFERMATAAAPHFDRFFICVIEKPDNPRPTGDIALVLGKAFANEGVAPSAINYCNTQEQALDIALKSLRQGHRFIAMGLRPEKSWRYVEAYFEGAAMEAVRSRRAS